MKLKKNSSDSVLQLTPSTFRNLFSWVSDLAYNSSSCVNSAGFVASFLERGIDKIENAVAVRVTFSQIESTRRPGPSTLGVMGIRDI